MIDKFNVLVVDDNPSNRMSLAVLLGRLPNCRLIEAGSGEETLLLTMQHDVQLILLDVHMPGMDGFETARHLQMAERTRTIPVVFITGVFMGDEFISHGYALGAVDYLVKPLDDNLLLNRVRQYQHLYERELALQRRTHDLEASNQQLSDTLQRLHMAQDKLVQSEKLAALGAIVAAVAHELNTPIGNCMTVASTLEDNVVSFERAISTHTALKRSQLDEYLKVSRTASQLMLRGLQRAAELVANFKQVAVDHTSSQRRNFELAEIIGGVVQLMNATLNKTPYRVEIDIPPGLWMDSYPGPIDQIVSNLINNSVLHGFQGRASGKMRLRAWRNGTMICLEYSDDGVGMSDEVRQHVFDPFFTTRLGKGGSGLGMNICYNLVTGLLGGTIEAAAGDDGGCIFKLELPQVAPPEQVRA
ncbi:sensor histidine kinase [Pseudoduganella violaceinigra]|uniref:sensor histidine kinase n=1 Tax=Pseudoduganella violaceinigra TaxID=246602 RepID=UPI0003F6A16B|nr:response regulator [Pseudoduganella violaceinigra]